MSPTRTTTDWSAGNALSLTTYQWPIAILLTITLLWALPVVGPEPDDFANDDRLPYELSEDYFSYGNRTAEAVRRSDVLVVGDSVVWGEYVASDQTLPAILTARSEGRRFANLGVNGIHPLALEGLLRYHAGSLRATKTVLHLNLLWMSSPERDLSTEKEISFNHPDLIPQFWPEIPCYERKQNERIGVCIDRLFRTASWSRHLRVTYWDGLDLPNWTLSHPYDNPLSAKLVTKQRSRSRHSQLDWVSRGLSPQHFPWVKLTESLQWAAFRRTVQLLSQRNNQVLVVVGSMNEHLLTDDSRSRYQQLVSDVEQQLRQDQVSYLTAELLPSSLYADASHPLADGYLRTADWLLSRREFQSFLE